MDKDEGAEEDVVVIFTDGEEASGGDGELWPSRSKPEPPEAEEQV